MAMTSNLDIRHRGPVFPCTADLGDERVDLAWLGEVEATVGVPAGDHAVRHNPWFVFKRMKF
jgi:hypothetical protein